MPIINTARKEGARRVEGFTYFFFFLTLQEGVKSTLKVKTTTNSALLHY